MSQAAAGAAALPDGAPDAASQIASVVFAVLLIDPRGRIAQANPAAEDLLGRSAARLIGAPLAAAIPLDDARVAAELARADTPLVARDVALAAGGAARRVNITSSPVHGHAGWRAVTLSDRGSDTGMDSAAAVAGEDAALRTPAILAHEIKNPLAAIRGACQLLARRIAPRDQPLAAIITGEVDRIAGLVDRMQQLGRAPAAAPGACNLHAAIRRALASVRAARGDGVELVEAFDPSLPAIAADAAVLEQIVINLVTNAADACAGRDGARVTVSTRFVSGPVFTIVRLGRALRLPVEITVSDNGPGIDPALRDHVFEPFVTGKPRGQGLGLALVRKLVRDLGGRIAHDRDDRAGLTHFRLNLAIATGPAPAGSGPQGDGP